MLEALAGKLVSASVATLATNLFVGHMPESPDACIALFEYQGNAPKETLKDMSGTVENPSVQVMARGATYPAGRALMVSARNTLTSITDETLSGLRFLRVSQLSSINSIGRDATERSVFTLSLQVFMER
jgi:hypothetical protein